MAVSVHAHWLSRARAPQQVVTNYLLPRNTGEYNDDDVRYIVEKYWQHGAEFGVDPLLASAQMILETANLSSFWSQRPRRNPAGIGVTGEPGAGVSFPNWDVAIMAHLGRILAYALPYGCGTPNQSGAMMDAMEWRSLPIDRRGQGADIETLARWWAADPQYATKIAALAENLL